MTILLLSSETPWRQWLQYGIGIALALLLAILLLAAIAAWQKHRARGHFRLTIGNQGNIRSRYALRALSRGADLKFKFSLNNTPLPLRRLAELPQEKQLSAPGAPEFESLDFGDTDDDAFVEAAAGGGMMGKASGIANMAGVAGELFYLAGSVLPRSLRTPIQRVGSRLRRGRTAMRRVERVSKKAGIGGDAPAPRQAARHGGAANAEQAVNVWSQTPYIEPGHTLTVELQVERSGFFQGSQPLPVKILSRSIEIEDAPLLVEEVVLQTKGGSFITRLVTLLLIAALVIIPAALCAAAAALI